MQERHRAEDELEISSVPTESVAYVWSSQIEMIERAMSKGQGDWGSSGDMLARILSGRSYLWAVHRGDDVVAVVVTAARSNRHMMKLFVEMVAGRDLEEWIDQMVTLLRDLMELIGADCIEASCRPGLAKILKSKGWSRKAIIMELK